MLIKRKLPTFDQDARKSLRHLVLAGPVLRAEPDMANFDG
jgi:hypothetical protein